MEMKWYDTPIGRMSHSHVSDEMQGNMVVRVRSTDVCGGCSVCGYHCRETIQIADKVEADTPKQALEELKDRYIELAHRLDDPTSEHKIEVKTWPDVRHYVWATSDDPGGPYPIPYIAVKFNNYWDEGE